MKRLFFSTFAFLLALSAMAQVAPGYYRVQNFMTDRHIIVLDNKSKGINVNDNTIDADALRNAGISCEIYPDTGKLKKQFDYAQKKAIPFISINGSDEVSAGKVNVKNLSSGEQRLFDRGDIAGLRGFIGEN